MLLKLFKNTCSWCAIAFSFLTRLPVPGLRSVSFSPKNLVRSLIAYPLVGLVFGTLNLALATAGLAIHLDLNLVAFVILATPFVLNRFLHFDGFCDVMDAFLADKTPAERLEIMKDSRNGSFALGSALLFILGKFLVIASLLLHGLGFLFVFAPVVSRWLMVPMAFRAVYPRSKGTGFAVVGQVPVSVLIAATLVLFAASGAGAALVAVAGTTGFFAAPVCMEIAVAISAGLAASLVWMLVLRVISARAIGGVTGDVLGFVSETTELVFLLGACLPLMIGHNSY